MMAPPALLTDTTAGGGAGVKGQQNRDFCVFGQICDCVVGCVSIKFFLDKIG